MAAPSRDTQAAIALSCSELVELLDELYPERSPHYGDSEQDIWMQAGQRDLVRRLLLLREEATIRRLPS